MAAFCAAGQDGPDKLTFRDGDSLAGRLISFDFHTGAQWRRSDSPQPLVFLGQKVAAIDLGRQPAPAAWQPGACRVRLRGGDGIEGVLTSADMEWVQVQGAIEGQARVPASAVVSLTMAPVPGSAIYDGPTGMEGWTLGSSAAAASINAVPWMYRNGAFYSSRSAAIARDVKLPDTARIEFDLRWQNIFFLNVALYADSLQPVLLNTKENEPTFGGFYSLQLNSSFADVLPVRQRDPQRSLGSAPLLQIPHTNQAHFEIRVKKSAKTITLLINGEKAAEWTDPEGFIGSGTILRFVNQGLGAVKLSGIHVTAWDGAATAPGADAAQNGKAQALWADGSLATAGFFCISNSLVTVSNAQGAVSAPLARLKELRFQPPTSASRNDGPATARVFFGQSSRLTLQLERADATALEGTHPDLGRVRLDAAQITRIQMLGR